MKFKKLSSLLFAFVFAFAFLVAGCSNGSDDSNSAEEQSGTITLSAEATSATVGDVVLFQFHSAAGRKILRLSKSM